MNKPSRTLKIPRRNKTHVVYRRGERGADVGSYYLSPGQGARGRPSSIMLLNTFFETKYEHKMRRFLNQGAAQGTDATRF